MLYPKEFDVIVVGGGHAGTEGIFAGTVCWMSVSKLSTPMVFNMADTSAGSTLL